eukprot:349682-Chlamydomonas_euryale.AAC.7
MPHPLGNRCGEGVPPVPTTPRRVRLPQAAQLPPPACYCCGNNFVDTPHRSLFCTPSKPC